jgi:hypothetical protein
MTWDFWDTLNVLGRFVLAVFVVIKVTRFSETLNVSERIGLGFMGGGSLLTVLVIMEPRGSPFEGWATTLITWGAVIFICGRTYRDWKHERRNQRQIAAASAHLRARGKL